MALKYKYAKREEIPAEVATLYVEREGAFHLDAEGVTEKAKADELRNHNIELRKKLEDVTARFDGIDPEAARNLAEEKRKLEEEKQLKAGEVDKVVENRVKSLKADWDKQVNTLTAERDALTARLTAIQIDQGVITTATKRGLRPTAIPDITARARSVFKLVNGVPQAFEADGTSVRYGKDGVTPMTLEEWVDAQVADAPHLFESNAGGGAAGNGGGAAAGSNRSVKNPFRKESWNLTEQMKLQKSDPALAARLKAAAWQTRNAERGIRNNGSGAQRTAHPAGKRKG
jgi:hypothetical protein